jgi:ornithine cyclodeaminase
MKLLSDRLNIVPFVSVDSMMKLVLATGIERFLSDLADFIEADFRRWDRFQKTARLAAHGAEGVIELMPTCDSEVYGFKYVTGHPRNTRTGRQTVAAFGVLADMATGYPLLLTEMTILTALRTAATSAVAAKYLAPEGAQAMAVIGNGAQAEFQVLAFRTLLNIGRVRLYDKDIAASQKCMRNLAGFPVEVEICASVEEALLGCEIVTTVTADRQRATILTDNLIGAGIHINAVGGDAPGKTEIHADILRRSDIFVEYAPQTRVEGEIQQLAADHPVTELWQVIAGEVTGRRDARQITLFDSVGFAIEDFSSLRYVHARLSETPFYDELDLIADPDEPRDLFGMLLRAQAAAQ